MTTTTSPPLPPRWFVTTAWKVHRRLYRVTRGRRGLWAPGGKRGWGALLLTTTGRRSGQRRDVIVGYLLDGDVPFTLAMNGWGEGEPSWWLNLQADPAAHVVSVDGEHDVVAREAHGEERDRLWARFAEVDQDLDGYAALRPTPTAVVVLEPR
jgi:deazaflavin-dependent oxidoreductase (nitroreductase family)